MQAYSYKTKPGKSAKVLGRSLNVSFKNSQQVCKMISGMPLAKGKKAVEDLLERKRSIGGRFYTNAAKEISGLLKSAEANAEFKSLDAERLFILASANKGMRYRTPRKFQSRGSTRMLTHIQVVLEQR